jgi:adenine-specific DNA-methyltransferase
MPKKNTATKKQVDALVHEDAKRKNIPTAEFGSVMEKDAQTPIELAYERRYRARLARASSDSYVQAQSDLATSVDVVDAV